MCIPLNVRNCRVKSLSKGNGSKKDVSSSTLNLRESTKVPLSTALPAPSNYEDDVNEMWNEENDEFDASDYEQEKQMWKKNVKPEVSYAQERIQKPNIPMKSRDMPRPDMKKSNSDDNLNALLQVTHSPSKKESYVFMSLDSRTILTGRRRPCECTP